MKFLKVVKKRLVAIYAYFFLKIVTMPKLSYSKKRGKRPKFCKKGMDKPVLGFFSNQAEW